MTTTERKPTHTMLTALDRITIRPTKEDAAILQTIHDYMRQSRRGMWPTRTDAIRFALREAARTIATTNT